MAGGGIIKQGFPFGKVTVVCSWALGDTAQAGSGLEFGAGRQVMAGEGPASGALTCFPGSPHTHSSGRLAALNGSGRNRSGCPWRGSRLCCCVWEEAESSAPALLSWEGRVPPTLPSVPHSAKAPGMAVPPVVQIALWLSHQWLISRVGSRDGAGPVIPKSQQRSTELALDDSSHKVEQRGAWGQK